MRIFSILLRSTLHWAIFPKRSDSVNRVVAVNRGSELSLLEESSEPDDGDRGRRCFGSPSILTRARSFSEFFSLCFLLGGGAAASAGGCFACRTFAGRGSSGMPLCFSTRGFGDGALSDSGVCGCRSRSAGGGGGMGRDGRSRGSLSTRCTLGIGSLRRGSVGGGLIGRIPGPSRRFFEICTAGGGDGASRRRERGPGPGPVNERDLDRR